MCGECSQCMDHTGFAPAQGMCTLLVYTAQVPGCSARELSIVGPGFCVLARSKLLRFRFSGTPQRYRLGWAFCAQVWAAQASRCLVSALFHVGCVLVSFPVLDAQFPGCTTRAPSQVCFVSPLGSWSLTVTLLADVNHPGSLEDLVSNWEPVHSLVEDAVSGAEIAPCLLALAVTRLPLCLQQGDGLVHSRLAPLWYLLNPLFCEQARLCLRLELFTGKFSLSLSLSFFFWGGCYITLAPSDCP